MIDLVELIPRALQNDEAAIGEIVAEYSPLIEYECARLGIWNHPDWSQSDLSQEVTFRVWSKLDQFRGLDSENPHAVFEQWIRVTAKSVIQNLGLRLSRKKRTPENGLAVYDEATNAYFRNSDRTPSSIAKRNEEVTRIQEAMASVLDMRQQEILNLRIVEGMSLTEISDRLSIDYDHVRYQFRTALAKLERRLS